jgi:hypothetical protein
MPNQIKYEFFEFLIMLGVSLSAVIISLKLWEILWIKPIGLSFPYYDEKRKKILESEPIFTLRETIS